MRIDTARQRRRQRVDEDERRVQALGVIAQEAAGGVGEKAAQAAVGVEAAGFERHGDAALDMRAAVEWIGAARVFLGELPTLIGAFRDVGRVEGVGELVVMALEHARDLLPDDVVVRSTLALVLDGARRWPEAEREYRKALEMDPNNGVVLNNLAYMLSTD